MEHLDNFINEYFFEIKKINNFHYNFLKQNNFEFPKVDYFQIYDFIKTATNFLLDIEPHLLDGLGAKLYEDIKSLYEYYQNFYKKTEYNHLVFYGEYLETLQEYNDLKKEYEKLKVEISKYNEIIKRVENELRIKDEKNEKDENYKNLKKTYVDSIYALSKIKDKFEEVKNSLKEIEEREKLKFIDKFDKEKELNLLKLKKIISVKLYYYETLLWYLAAQSENIKKFFQEADIKGDFSTKTFIKYFLKNIDITKAKNSNWFNYLNNLLRIL